MSEIQKFYGEGAQPLPRPHPRWGGGHPLPTPYPSRRLRRLDSRAFGARLRRLDPPICAMTNITYFRPCSPIEVGTTINFLNYND